MARNAHTKCPALAAPLLLLLALTQAGSCRNSASANSADGANKPAAAAASGARANVAAAKGGDTNTGGKVNLSANRSIETGGGGVVPTGTWGGEHVRLTVRSGGADIEFDCAHGRMAKLTTDAAGNFSAEGVFVAERGGPVRPGDREDARPARYSGRVEGKHMTLSFTVGGADEEAEPVVYKLTRGAEAELTKCL